ncbi:NAD(P)/FAD-dependent oxidoreductase [Actinoplanes sp. TBRC 11911]|uniref:phytoene desaturase family protein n=1 Tax=Actinoplanes sp. TBRC 11911 TaxID=2729386 RepID=UPI00145E40E4|nr:NAD(P)/FAD-dependent oxidoreductase [Actinoplanes sp. TBRC 11911]NMO55898.1 NAD(P)/FAD-dependent oxidoreductase [Actinoplanes sp. TBRC 11911]
MPPLRDHEFDVVFIGAGHNALVAAAYLARAGRSVLLLERTERAGGFVRTQELTLPGFLHDTYSAVHPLFAEFGLRYVRGDVSTGVSLPGGRGVVIPTDPRELDAELDRLGERGAWYGLFADLAPVFEEALPLLGTDLTSLDATATFNYLTREFATAPMPFEHLLAGNAADLLTDRFRSEELRANYLAWPVHMGVGPRDASGAFWVCVMMAALAGGNPQAVGGSGRLADALVALVEKHGGVIVTGAEADTIVVDGGRATGVRTKGGEVFTATSGVVATTSPDALYNRLLRDVVTVPPGVRSQAARYRYRRGCLQVNLALNGKPHFADARMDHGGLITLGRGFDDMIAAVRQADDGVIPEHPTISWHEPSAVDPGRAPDGSATVRLQIFEAPLYPKADAAGVIPTDGTWTRDVGERYADRIVAEAAQHVEGLEDMIVGRHVLTPADIAAANPNAGPGDSNAGHNALSQGFTQRPLPAHRGGYATVVPGLYMIGGATWPGPGVSGASGRAVAQILLG